jgi:hypothetical protein
MKTKKQYTSMQITKLGNLDELTMLGLGKSGGGTDGMNQVGNMMN